MYRYSLIFYSSKLLYVKVLLFPNVNPDGAVIWEDDTPVLIELVGGAENVKVGADSFSFAALGEQMIKQM